MNTNPGNGTHHPGGVESVYPMLNKPQRQHDAVVCTFSHPDCDCRLRSFTESTVIIRKWQRVAGCTADREFHPAPKVYRLQSIVDSILTACHAACNRLSYRKAHFVSDFSALTGL